MHNADPNTRTPAGSLGLDSQKYVELGLPPDCADFVYMCMEGKEVRREEGRGGFGAELLLLL